MPLAEILPDETDAVLDVETGRFYRILLAADTVADVVDDLDGMALMESFDGLRYGPARCMAEDEHQIATHVADSIFQTAQGTSVDYIAGGSYDEYVAETGIEYYLWYDP